MRQELPGVGDEGLEQGILCLRQVDAFTIEGDQTLPEIDDQRTVDEGRRLRRVGGAATQRGAQTCEDLLHPERLGHVVVGPRVQRRHLVGLAVPDRKDDDGHRRERPDAADHLGPVQIRKAEVEEDKVGCGFGRRDDRLLAVRGRLDLVPVRLEAGSEGASDLWLVVDDEHVGHAPRSVVP